MIELLGVAFPVQPLLSPVPIISTVQKSLSQQACRRAVRPGLIALTTRMLAARMLTARRQNIALGAACLTPVRQRGPRRYASIFRC